MLFLHRHQSGIQQQAVQLALLAKQGIGIGCMKVERQRTAVKLMPVLQVAAHLAAVAAGYSESVLSPIARSERWLVCCSSLSCGYTTTVRFMIVPAGNRSNRALMPSPRVVSPVNRPGGGALRRRSTTTTLCGRLSSHQTPFSASERGSLVSSRSAKSVITGRDSASGKSSCRQKAFYPQRAARVKPAHQPAVNGLFILADRTDACRFKPGGEPFTYVVQRLFRGRFIRGEAGQPAVNHHPRAPPCRPPAGTGDGVIEKQPSSRVRFAIWFVICVSHSRVKAESRISGEA